MNLGKYLLNEQPAFVRHSRFYSQGCDEALGLASGGGEDITVLDWQVLNKGRRGTHGGPNEEAENLTMAKQGLEDLGE